MKNDLNIEEFFTTYHKFQTSLYEILKVSDDELVRNFCNEDCVISHNLLDRTDDPSIFRREITNLRIIWDSILNEMFEHNEAQSVNKFLTELEDMVR